MTDEALCKYVLNQRRLLELELHSEKEEEEEGNKNDNVSSPLNKRDETIQNMASRSLNNLQLDHFSVGLMGRTVIQLCPIKSHPKISKAEKEGGTSKPRGHLLPAHRLTVGDEVEIVPKNNKSSRKSVGGVVSSLTDTTVSIALFSKGDGPTNNNTGDNDEEEMNILGGLPPFSVLPRSSVAVHKKMTDALQELERHGLDHPIAGSILRAVFDPSSRSSFLGGGVSKPPAPQHNTFIPYNSNLDESQLDAIKFALNEQRPISLIRELLLFCSMRS